MIVIPLIRELADEFDGELECLGENTEKYITFSVKVNKKIMKRDKDDGEKIANIPYRQKYFDSYRFMSAPLSNHVDNLSNGLHRTHSLFKDDLKVYQESHKILKDVNETIVQASHDMLWQNVQKLLLKKERW